MVLIGKTTKGYWPDAVDGKIPGFGDQLVGYKSHPYAMKMNSEYFVALARTFEKHYGVEFQGIDKGPVTEPGCLATCRGVPRATICPPASPAAGPKSKS